MNETDVESQLTIFMFNEDLCAVMSNLATFNIFFLTHIQSMPDGINKYNVE